MGLSKIIGFNAVSIVFFLLLAANATAETTFFDQGDVFIMGNPPTGAVIEKTVAEAIREAILGGGCTYRWNCTNWGECSPVGKQARNCTNIGSCSSAYKTPELKQNCTYAAPETVKKGNESEKGNVIETGGRQEEIAELIWKIADNNRLLLYLAAVPMACFIIIYLKKGCFKKADKKKLK